MFERGPPGTTDWVSLRVGRLGSHPGPWISLPLSELFLHFLKRRKKSTENSYSVTYEHDVKCIKKILLKRSTPFMNTPSVAALALQWQQNRNRTAHRA